MFVCKLYIYILVYWGVVLKGIRFNSILLYTVSHRFNMNSVHDILSWNWHPHPSQWMPIYFFLNISLNVNSYISLGLHVFFPIIDSFLWTHIRWLCDVNFHCLCHPNWLRIDYVFFYEAYILEFYVATIVRACWTVIKLSTFSKKK